MSNNRSLYREILVVDNEKFVLDTLKNELSRLQFNVTRAASGDEAVAHLSRQGFDVVIADLQVQNHGDMPILQKIKEIAPETGVIIMTGYSDMMEAIGCLLSGAEDYLIKPFDMDELILRIARTIEKKDLLRRVTFYEEILPVCTVCDKSTNREKMSTDEDDGGIKG